MDKPTGSTKIAARLLDAAVWPRRSGAKRRHKRKGNVDDRLAGLVAVSSNLEAM
jgi:hypothetical protein